MDGNEKELQANYSAREIIESIQDLKKDLENTQIVVRKYNNLREDLNWCISQIKSNTITEDTKYSILAGIREWGGWIVAIGVLLLKWFGG